MCYNCGCQMPDNDMGNADNITNLDFEKAAKAGNNGDVRAAMEETYALLGKVLGKHEHGHDHDHAHAHAH